MRRSLIIVLLFIVLAPLLVLGGLGAKVASDERAILRHRLEELLMARLRDTDAKIADLIADRRRELAALTVVADEDPETLRRLCRDSPHVRQLFIRGADGRLIFPATEQPLTRDEREFLVRTRQLWSKRDLFVLPSEEAVVAPLSKRSSVRQAIQSVRTPLATASPARDGWYVWFVGDDLGLIYWRRDQSGKIFGAELDRIRLLSDIVALLPATSRDDGSMADDRVVLADARGAPVYQWGLYEQGEDDRPAAALALSAPLSLWKLRYYVSPAGFDAALGGGALISLIAGLAVVGLLLIAGAFYFYRESTRELRGATERVSFVNQVSHELKTPLTNIRMYAELLAQDMPDADDEAADPKAKKRIDIIVSESQRLSRLIANVLAFARQGRGALRLRRTPGVVDEVVSEVLEQFEPALARTGIALATKLAAPATVQLDRDVVGQIVANLIGNVEKYAGGGTVRIETSQTVTESVVIVHDSGPGIPMAQAERAFSAFGRLDNRLTEGVSGTGIGLSLARDLARLHGGDLLLLPSEHGARLQLTLATPHVARPPEEE